MKPIVIIIIAVVCSVIAVLGVLIVLQEIAVYQAQIAFDEYQVELQEDQFYSEQMQSVENQLNRNVCVDMFSNVMSMYGESNPYQDCLDYGFWFALESELNKCQIYDTVLVVESCQSSLWATFYDSMMPRVQALSQEQRDYLTYDKETMQQFSVEWEFWSDLYLETQLEIGEISAIQSAIQSAKDEANREKIREQCLRYEEAKNAFDEMMKGYQEQISAGQITYKDLDRLESQAKRDTGYYDGMSNYMMSNC